MTSDGNVDNEHMATASVGAPSLFESNVGAAGVSNASTTHETASPTSSSTCNEMQHDHIAVIYRDTSCQSSKGHIRSIESLVLQIHRSVEGGVTSISLIDTTPSSSTYKAFKKCTTPNSNIQQPTMKTPTRPRYFNHSGHFTLFRQSQQEVACGGKNMTLVTYASNTHTPILERNNNNSDIRSHADDGSESWHHMSNSGAGKSEFFNSFSLRGTLLTLKKKSSHGSQGSQGGSSVSAGSSASSLYPISSNDSEFGINNNIHAKDTAYDHQHIASMPSIMSVGGVLSSGYNNRHLEDHRNTVSVPSLSGISTAPISYR